MTATWRQVARKDFEDAARSRLLWGLIAVFLAFLVMALLSAEQMFPETSTVDARKALSGVALLAQLFVPGIALVVGYLAVAGERQSGSLRVLLSYPFSRFDVVAGKFLGRLLVTGTSLAVSYAVASAVVAWLFDPPGAWVFAGFVATGVLLGLTFTGIAVGGSAAAASRGGAMALTVGSFAGMVFFWKPVVVGLHYLVEGSIPGVEVPAWYLFVDRLNPLESFRVLVRALLDRPVWAVPRLPLEDVPLDATGLDAAARLAGEVPFFLEAWFAVVVLLAWGVVPAAVGYWRFDRSDLG